MQNIPPPRSTQKWNQMIFLGYMSVTLKVYIIIFFSENSRSKIASILTHIMCKIRKKMPFGSRIQKGFLNKFLIKKILGTSERKLLEKVNLCMVSLKIFWIHEKCKGAFCDPPPFPPHKHHKNIKKGHLYLVCIAYLFVRIDRQTIVCFYC